MWNNWSQTRTPMDVSLAGYTIYLILFSGFFFFFFFSNFFNRLKSSSVMRQITIKGESSTTGGPACYTREAALEIRGKVNACLPTHGKISQYL